MGLRDRLPRPSRREPSKSRVPPRGEQEGIPCAGRPSQGADRPEVGRHMCEPQSRQQSPNRLEPAPERKAENTTEALHLAASHLVEGMRLEPRIKNLIHLLVIFEEAGDLQGVLVVAMDS